MNKEMEARRIIEDWREYRQLGLAGDPSGPHVRDDADDLHWEKSVVNLASDNVIGGDTKTLSESFSDDRHEPRTRLDDVGLAELAARA
jgi:hypothetical protein